MKQKDIIKTLMMISNGETPLVSMVCIDIIQRFRG